MSLARALKQLFPDLEIGDAGAQCQIEHLADGKHVISVWRRAEPQPTQAEIDAAEIEAAAVEAQAEQDKATLANIRTQVRQAFTALSTIQGAASFTNAQRDAAIKELAQILERLIRVTMDIAR